MQIVPATVYLPAVLPVCGKFGCQMVVAAPDADAVAGRVGIGRDIGQQPRLLLAAEHPDWDRTILAVMDFRQYADIHAKSLEQHTRARCRCCEHLRHSHGKHLRHYRAMRMTGRVYAGTVDSMVCAYFFEQCAEE